YRTGPVCGTSPLRPGGLHVASWVRGVRRSATQGVDAQGEGRGTPGSRDRSGQYRGASLAGGGADAVRLGSERGGGGVRAGDGVRSEPDRTFVACGVSGHWGPIRGE